MTVYPVIFSQFHIYSDAVTFLGSGSLGLSLVICFTTFIVPILAQFTQISRQFSSTKISML